MAHVPSVTQFEIAFEDQHAVIVEVGGGIRSCDVGGVEVLQPHAVDQMCDGAHGAPLAPGVGTVDDCSLQLQIETRILTDPQRQLPTGREDVDKTPFDFRAGKKIGHLAIDDAFTDLRRDERGRAWVRLENPDGRVTSLWVDQAYPVIEIYTGDTLVPTDAAAGWAPNP